MWHSACATPLDRIAGATFDRARARTKKQIVEGDPHGSGEQDEDHAHGGIGGRRHPGGGRPDVPGRRPADAGGDLHRGQQPVQHAGLRGVRERLLGEIRAQRHRQAHQQRPRGDPVGAGGRCPVRARGAVDHDRLGARQRQHAHRRDGLLQRRRFHRQGGRARRHRAPGSRHRRRQSEVDGRQEDRPPHRQHQRILSARVVS